MSVSGRHLLGSEEEKQLLVANQEMDDPSVTAVNYNTMNSRTDASQSSLYQSAYEEAEDLSHEVQA